MLRGAISPLAGYAGLIWEYFVDAAEALGYVVDALVELVNFDQDHYSSSLEAAI